LCHAKGNIHEVAKSEVVWTIGTRRAHDRDPRPSEEKYFEKKEERRMGR
jgi:hypothetical protein